MARKLQNPKTVETLTHEEATRKNIPTAEYQSVIQKLEVHWMSLPMEQIYEGLESE